jgi:hypothetical protein
VLGLIFFVVFSFQTYLASALLLVLMSALHFHSIVLVNECFVQSYLVVSVNLFGSEYGLQGAVGFSDCQVPKRLKAICGSYSTYA